MDISLRTKQLNSLFSYDKKTELEESHLEIIPFRFTQTRGASEIDEFQKGLTPTGFCPMTDDRIQENIGKLLLTGKEGVPKDIDAAIHLLKDSAAQGNQFAQYTLGKFYLLGQEVQADREEALRYFAQAAAQGNTYAQYFIDHQEDFSSAAAGTAILRMLHQMSRIFRENAAQPAIYTGMQIDKKRRRRLQEKRMAMGHKADDHEDRGLTQQTQ